MSSILHNFHQFNSAAKSLYYSSSLTRTLTTTLSCFLGLQFRSLDFTLSQVSHRFAPFVANVLSAWYARPAAYFICIFILKMTMSSKVLCSWIKCTIDCYYLYQTIIFLPQKILNKFMSLIFEIYHLILELLAKNML